MDTHRLMQCVYHHSQRSGQTYCFRNHLQQHEFELAGCYRARELQHY